MIVKKVFELTFDEPSPYWLCADNLSIALHQVCINTKFKVQEVSCDPEWTTKDVMLAAVEPKE